MEQSKLNCLCIMRMQSSYTTTTESNSLWIIKLNLLSRHIGWVNINVINNFDLNA